MKKTKLQLFVQFDLVSVTHVVGKLGFFTYSGLSAKNPAVMYLGSSPYPVKIPDESFLVLLDSNSDWVGQRKERIVRNIIIDWGK